MSQTKKATVETPWDTLSLQVEGLNQAKPEEFRQTLADLVVPRIDRIRIFAAREGGREMIKEFVAPVANPARVARKETGLTAVEHPEVTAALTLKPDGTISIDVESEPALIGEDLFQLADVDDEDDEDRSFDDPMTDDFVSAQDISDELGVSKSTITRRIKDNKLLGYHGFKRDWLIPRAQFKDRNVVPGIAETIALFDNEHREAWFFLSFRLYYGDDNPRPIDRLRVLRRSDKDGLNALLAELKAAKDSHDHGDHF